MQCSTKISDKKEFEIREENGKYDILNKEIEHLQFNTN